MIGWLADKSALTRLRRASDVEGWMARIDRGLVRISTLTRLEMGYSTRSGTELRDMRRSRPATLMPVEYLTPRIEDRAVEVQQLLADRGEHRAPGVPDLLIAATAELAELTVLHTDKDFELIAALTGQSVERLSLS